MQTDYSTRIANHFLEERAQLGAALFSLSSLADESLATLPAAANLRTVQANLRRPFVFLAVGEASAGKSSLLNALFGREFSDPDERCTSVFKYGEESSDTPLTASVVERRRPLAFLRDFQLVDTAAASAILTDHNARIEDLAPTADLILFVVSVVDPWNENAWDLLESAHAKHRKDVVIAMQGADERPEREVEAICQHLERVALSRLGHEVPVFPVSARRALLARTSGLDRARLWRESGFARLEACIDGIVGGNAGRGADLPNAAGEGRAVLRDIALGVERLAGEVEAERSAIAGALATIGETQASCQTLISNLQKRLLGATSRCARQGENLLRIRVEKRPWPTLRGTTAGTRWGRAFHRNLAGFLKSAFDQEIEDAINAMITHFQVAADRLLAACDQPTEAVGADRYNVAAREVSARCGQLAEEAELTLVEHLSQDSVEEQVQGLLDQSSQGLRRGLVGTSIGVVTAVAAALAHLPVVALGAVVFAMAFGLAASVRAARRRQEALACYRAATPTFHSALVAAIDEAFRLTAAECCGQLRSALEPLSAHCDRRAERVLPIREQVAGLENVFRRIASRS